MLKRITKLLDAWESLMRSEQKAFELNIKAFELSIENQENSKKIDIFRLQSRKNVIENINNPTSEDLEELRFVNEALRLLEWGNLNVKL